LRELYYRSKQTYFDPGSTLFDIGEPCKDIFIILSGVCDIIISDGDKNKAVLDIMGKGSVIGNNFIFTREPWMYKAQNNSVSRVQVIMISS